MSRKIEDKIERPLKILFVTESYPPETYGGGEISCALLAEELAKRRELHVTVLTSDVEGLPSKEKKGGVHILRRLKTGRSRDTFIDNIKRKMFFEKSVKKELNKISEDYDLVHFFNITSIVKVNKPSFATINSYVNFCPKGNLFYNEMEVCQGCRPGKFIGCITSSEYVGGYKLSNLLRYNPIFWLSIYLDYLFRKKSLKKVDYFFSLSDFINGLLKEEGVKSDNIRKVVNMPDIELSDKKIKLPKEGTNVTYIGLLSKIKGVHLLIKAFDQIDTDANLVIVGDGPERQKLEELAKNNPNILFLGKVEHDLIHSVYEQSDVITVPSLWPEPLSRVLLEAAYFGKPIVATDVGGSSEVVKHGYNGLLAEPNIQDISNKLKYILRSDMKRGKMGKNMRKFYKKKLSKDKMLNNYVNAYMNRSSLLKEKRDAVHDRRR